MRDAILARLESAWLLIELARIHPAEAEADARLGEAQDLIAAAWEDLRTEARPIPARAGLSLTMEGVPHG